MGDITEGWEAAASDPDPERDLGYEYGPLTATYVEEGKRYVLLPDEGNHRSDSEFLVVSSEDVCWLAEWR